MSNPSFEQTDEDQAGQGGAPGWRGAIEKLLRPTLSWGHENTSVHYGEKVDENETPVIGKVTFDEGVARTGKRSVCLEKATFAGTVRAETAAPLPVREGEEYLLEAYLRVEKPAFGTGVYLRVVMSGEGKKDQHAQTPYYVAMTLDNPPEGWRRIWLRFKVPEGYTHVCVGAEIRGAAQKTWWDDFDLRPAPTPVAQDFLEISPEEKAPKYSPEEVREIWRQRQPVKVETISDGGQPILVIDGERVPLLAYTSACGWWPGGAENKRMLEAGVKLHFIPIFLRRAWTAKDTYDFSEVGNKIESLLGYDPDAKVMFYLMMQTYPEWGDEHPDAVWHNPDGKKVVGSKATVQGKKVGEKRQAGQLWATSYTAAEFRRDLQEALTALAKYLNSIEVGKAFAGAHLLYGTDGQWFPQWHWNTLDQSPGNLQAFRDYLRELYHDDVAALRQAWGDPEVTFAAAKLAAEAERSPEHWFLHGEVGADRRVIDSGRFAAIGVSETIIGLATAFKQALGRNVYLAVYHHDILHGTSPHRAQKMLLESPAIDGIVSVMGYGGYRSLGQTGDMKTLAASLRLHHKIFIHEMDYRTYVCSAGEDANDRMLWLGAEKTEAGWLNQARRDLGMALCQGQGGWLYGIAGPTYTNDKFKAGLMELAKAADRSVQQPLPQDRGQMAVFCDEQSQDHLSRKAIFAQAYGMVAHGVAKLPLNRSGLSWDPYLLSDLEHPQRHKYKINIFLTATTITQEQIAWVQENLQKDGNVLVWIGAAGMCSGGDFETNIQHLAGMKIKYDENNFNLHRIYPVPSDDPLSSGLLDNITTELRTPLFHVDDPEAKTLGVIAKTGGKAGWAVKRFPDWTSVYIALPGALTPELLRNIGQEAGIRPVGPTGDVTFAGNGYLVIHALTAGDKTLQWQGKSDVFDLTAGDFCARGVESINIKMEAFETRWFRRMPAK